MKLTAIFEKANDGTYACWIEEFPEVISQGQNLKEAKANLMDALNLVLEYRREKAEEEIRSNHSNVTREDIPLAIG